VIFKAKNLAAATKFMWPFPDRGLRRRLEFLSVPTLVVHGESDRLVPLSYGRELARLIPNARLAPISGAGHLPMLEQESSFLAVVDEFLAE
jgi:pimeloyl-ACP methyl ester carboxylesterase